MHSKLIMHSESKQSTMKHGEHIQKRLMLHTEIYMSFFCAQDQIQTCESPIPWNIITFTFTLQEKSPWMETEKLKVSTKILVGSVQITKVAVKEVKI